MVKKPNATDTASANLEEAEAQEQHEVATQESSTPALRLGEGNIEESPEEILASGGIPTLRPAYGVGALSKEHVPGTWVLGDYVLAKKNEMLKVCVVGYRRYYKEVTQYIPGNPVRAKTFSTKKEVEAAGFSAEFRDNPDGGRRIPPDYRPAADFILLIEKPENHTSPYFTLSLNGKVYGLAKFYADKATYDKAGDPMIKVVVQSDVMWGAQFDLHTEDQKLGQQEVVLPLARILGRTDPDLEAEIAKTVSAL